MVVVCKNNEPVVPVYALWSVVDLGSWRRDVDPVEPFKRLTGVLPEFRKF
jgi:hypothetical protein